MKDTLTPGDTYDVPKGKRHAKHKRIVKKAMKAKAKPNKNAPLGQGGRFAALQASIAQRGNVSNPGAVAAAIGRAKYGKARFQKFAAKGR